LGGAAYAAFFGLGASFGARGGGRAAALVLDFLFGGGTTIALVTPRAHLRSLLGGTAPAEVSQRASSAVLVALTLVFAAIAIRRARVR
jgi:hypothetical protein